MSRKVEVELLESDIEYLNEVLKPFELSVDMLSDKELSVMIVTSMGLVDYRDKDMIIEMLVAANVTKGKPL